MAVLDRADLPFPHSLPEFQRLFPDDAACAAYPGASPLGRRLCLPALRHGGRAVRAAPLLQPMPNFTRESGGTQHVAVMGVNRIGKESPSSRFQLLVALHS